MESKVTSQGVHLKFNDERTNDVVEFNFEIQNNRSLLNKINFLLEDLKILYQKDPTFLDFFKKLYNSILKEDLVFKEKEIVSEMNKFTEILVDSRVSDISKFCDNTKRTKDSIYFDNDEMRDLLKLISIFKIIGLFIHSDIKEKHSMTIQDLLNAIAEKYSGINKKLYQIITAKALKGSITNKKYMNFLKFSLSYDYLILYNYSFITNVLICLYNWSKNPISYIVSLAGENFSYLIMTYSTVPLVYSSEELEVDVSSGDFLDSISFEMILQNIFDKLQKENVTIKDLYPTPVTDVLVLPLMSYITDIPTQYLEAKSNYDKLLFQYLIYNFLNKNRDVKNNYRDIIDDLNKALLYCFEIPVDYGEGILPSMLDVLKESFTYYNLENKSPVLNAVKTFSCFLNKRKYLRHIVTGEAFGKENNKSMNDILSNLTRFTIMVVSDKTRDEIRKSLKRQFIEFLGNVKLNKMLLSLYL